MLCAIGINVMEIADKTHVEVAHLCLFNERFDRMNSTNENLTNVQYILSNVTDTSRVHRRWPRAADHVWCCCTTTLTQLHHPWSVSLSHHRTIAYLAILPTTTTLHNPSPTPSFSRNSPLPSLSPSTTIVYPVSLSVTFNLTPSDSSYQLLIHRQIADCPAVNKISSNPTIAFSRRHRAPE